MRILRVAIAIAALAVPLAAQTPEGGVTAEGWEARLDREGDATSVLNFQSMGSGVHATTAGAGAATFWQAGSMAEGTYTISASFRQVEPSGHPNAYGLVFGGSDLSGPDQQYSYFELRQGGEFLIRNREGSETPDVVAWTAHSAINTLDDNGRSLNTLSVEVGADQVRFLVNGTEVSSQPKSALHSDGITGVRVNHLLNVHIDDLNLGG